MASSSSGPSQDPLRQAFRLLLREAKEAHGLTATEIERQLGHDSGYFSNIFKSRQTLSTELLRKVLDIVDKDPADFFNFAFPFEVPPPAVGVVLTYKERHKRRSRLLPKRRVVLRWCRTLTVDDRRDESAGIEDIDAAMHDEDHETALKGARRWLRSFLDEPPVALGRQTAEKLCFILLVFTEIARRRGDRNTAAETVDLAFRVEKQIDNLSLRAFIYRRGAYLLNDLGQLRIARLFASRAVQLCFVIDEPVGLILSQYVQASMFDYSGELEPAVRLYERCLRHLPDGSEDLAFVIRHALARGLLLLGNVEAATAELDRLVSTSSTAFDRPLWLGKLRLLQAEFASRQDRCARADAYFAEAEGLISSHGDPLDLAIFELKLIYHLTRYESTREIAARVPRLASLAQAFSRDEAIEAVLLEVAQEALRGGLHKSLVRESIDRIRRFGASVS